MKMEYIVTKDAPGLEVGETIEVDEYGRFQRGDVIYNPAKLTDYFALVVEDEDEPRADVSDEVKDHLGDIMRKCILDIIHLADANDIPLDVEVS